ncbi:MAG: hypothetical protein RR795_01670 [Cetobacterium sp.]|uniref:hypothetical protein n=1 Tax=Cetobacterium sp. TaxID=2071632 RepID=UPI002FCAEDBB
MKIFIYDINTLEIKGEPLAPSYNDFKNNPKSFYPNWDSENNIATEISFTDPIFKDGILREKTREEKIILDSKIELLNDGEYLENNKIIVVESQDNLLKKVWNKELRIWEEGITKDEIIKEVDKLIVDFISLSELKEKYFKYGFSTYEIEIEIANNIIRRNEMLSIII